MLNGRELVGIDVERDARPRMPHLSRDRHDIGALANQVRSERMPQIVKGELRLPLHVETRSISGLG